MKRKRHLRKEQRMKDLLLKRGFIISDRYSGWTYARYDRTVIGWYAEKFRDLDRLLLWKEGSRWEWWLIDDQDLEHTRLFKFHDIDAVLVNWLLTGTL